MAGKTKSLFNQRKELIAQLPEVGRLRQMFSLFDGDGSGRIEQSQLGDCLRVMGLDPSEAMMRVCRLELDERKGSRKCITFELALAAFCVLCDYCEVSDGCDAETLIKTLRDTAGTGLLPYAELRRMLTTMGERLNSIEVATVLQDIEVDSDGHVDYATLVRKMMSNADQRKVTRQQAHAYLDALIHKSDHLHMRRRDDFVEVLHYWKALRRAPQAKQSQRRQVYGSRVAHTHRHRASKNIYLGAATESEHECMQYIQ